MLHYIGIDLGTTNSVICSFDGKETTIWKSPEQSDVTPSAIYIDRRGHRFYGRKAFTMAAENEGNSATLFKRYLGTTRTYMFRDSGESLTPVECSAQLLRVLYGYLPEDVRNDPETVTVITVPAAFNQMKKDAALEAAKLAGLGRTALMQEPVAAVMSVLKKDDAERLFLIYDLGGGTFDISVAQFVGGHVSLIAQGGREMCGGRDMDRWIYEHKLLPWLREHFDIPRDPDQDEKYLRMKRSILLAAEAAKIALSSSQKTDLWIDEDTLRTRDESGKDIFLDLKLTRDDIIKCVSEMAEETCLLTLQTLQRAGVSAKQVDQIVFIGGPTMYAPLRDEVCALLGIKRGTAVNPMTAVAEGASIYAESINWEDEQHRRRKSIGELKSEEPEDEQRVTVRYEERTSLDKCKIAVVVPDTGMHTARVRSSAMTGQPQYDSGRISVIKQCIIEVPLPETGKYTFTLEVEDADKKTCISPKTIEVTRTLASIQAIPASHSIAVKALDRPGGTAVPVYLVEADDPLPKSGTIVLRAARQLVGGSDGALSFSLWEGEIRDPVDDNRYIGSYRIPGKAFHGGVITVGMEIICNYEMNEAGNLRLGVSVPGVGAQLEQQNFYSRLEGQVDIQDTYSLVKEINELLERTAQMQLRVVDESLKELREKLFKLRDILSRSNDPEEIARAESSLMDCYRQTALLHQRYAGVIKSQEVEKAVRVFDQLKKNAGEDEIASFRNLVESARFSIDMGSSDIEGQIQEMWRRIGDLRWRDDSFIRRVFLFMADFPGDYSDRARFDHLRAEGMTCLENNDMDALRKIINEIYALRKEKGQLHVERMFAETGVYLS